MKKLLAMMLSVVMVATMMAGCSSSSTETASTTTAAATTTEAAPAAEEAAPAAEAAETTASGTKTFAIVTKAAGNPFNERTASGFEEVILAEGYEVIVKHPEAATADAQVAVIQSLISQGVDAICIAANDENALQASLQEAMDEGIQVCCLDSKTNVASRSVFVNQAGVMEIGQALIDAVLDLTGGEGQWAVLSATSQAANQNAWIEAMKTLMTGEAYAGLELVEVAYGDDEPQKSTDQTQALLANYPDLEVICAPTTVGIAAAAKVLQDEKSSVKLTGLGLPSEMAEYIGEGEDFSCPYMFLWNPIDLGRLGAYTSIALVNGDITGAEGDSYTAGALGDYTIVAADDGGTEVILGQPFAFTPDNIADWKDVY